MAKTAKDRLLAQYLEETEQTQDQLAKRLKLSQAAISRWSTSGREIYIREESGKISAFELRPLGK